jgi:hypothetical protein
MPPPKLPAPHFGFGRSASRSRWLPGCSSHNKSTAEICKRLLECSLLERYVDCAMAYYGLAAIDAAELAMVWDGMRGEVLCGRQTLLSHCLSAACIMMMMMIVVDESEIFYNDRCCGIRPSLKHSVKNISAQLVSWLAPVLHWIFITSHYSHSCIFLTVSHVIIDIEPTSPTLPCYHAHTHTLVQQSINQSIMTLDVTYSNVMDVTLSWDRLKMTPNYKDVAGEHIFMM